MGDKVEAGQVLATLEAMKMRNNIRTEIKGVIKSIGCVVNESVQVDHLLFELE